MGSDYKTVREMASDEKTLSSQPANGLLLLASVLMESPYFKGGGTVTRRLLQKAWRLQPDSFLVCNTLGSSRRYAEDLGNKDLNVRFCTAAVALRPESASAHNLLAKELVTLHYPQPEFRERIVLQSVSERLPEAIAELTKAVRLNPEVGSFHRDLGCALFLIEDVYGEAVEEYRKAIKLETETVHSFMFRVELAYQIFNAGRPIDALAELRESLRLSKDPLVVKFGPDTGEEHLSEFERLAGLERQLPAILRGQNVPVRAEGKLDVARLCRGRREFAAASTVLPGGLRDQAGTGRRHGSPASSQRCDRRGPCRSRRRAGWRHVTAERCRSCPLVRSGPRLVACRTRLLHDDLHQGGLPEFRRARETLDILARHRDLACVRDEDQLKKLPEDERRSWQAFWAEVAALLKQAG